MKFRDGGERPLVCRSRSSLLIVVIAACSLPMSARGWVATKEFSVAAGASVWPLSTLGPGGSRPFKFVEGGSVGVSVTCQIAGSGNGGDSDNGSSIDEWLLHGLHVVLCKSRRTPPDLSDGKRFGNCPQSGCTNSFVRQTTFRCVKVTTTTTEPTNVTVSGATVSAHFRLLVNATQRVNVAILTCCPPPLTTSVTCKATLDLVNPGDEHLSADEFGLPQFFQVYLCVFFVLVLVWAANGVFYWRYSNKLHLTISVMVFIRLCEIGVNYWYWQNISLTGENNRPVGNLRKVVMALKWSMYFVFMMLAGSGVGIQPTKPRALLSVMPVTGVVFLSMLIYFFVNHYALALTIISALLAIFGTVRRIRVIFHQLQKIRIEEARFFRQNPEAKYTTGKTIQDRVKQKILLLRVVLVYCLSFPLIYVVANAVVNARYTDQMNISEIVQELTEVLFMLSILWFFRLHDCPAYGYIVINYKNPNAIVVVGPGKRSLYVTLPEDSQTLKKEQ